MTATNRVFAWTVATGESLVAFMVVWLLAARLMDLFLVEPLAAVAAMAIALAAGILTITVEGFRRSAQLRRLTSLPSA
jgi:hypothetical protein